MLFTRTLLALAATLIVSGQNGAMAQNKPKEITIVLPSTTFALAHLRAADKLGLYEKNGIKPKFIIGENGASNMAALLSGSVEVVSAGIDELLSVRARGNKDAGIILNGYRGLASVVVLRKDIAAKLDAKPDSSPDARLKALAGITLATPSPNSGVLSGLKIASRMANINNISYTSVQQPAMFAAMKTGAIQGYVATSPFWEPAVDSGIAVRWLSGPKGEYPEEALSTTNAVLQATFAYAQKNPDVIRALRASIDEMAKAVKERPTEVRKAVKELYPDLPENIVAEAVEANAPGWIQPTFSEADLRKEVNMRKDVIENVDKVDPASLMLPR